MNQTRAWAGVVVVGLASVSQAFTMATYSDPTQGSAEAMFFWDRVASTLSGSWSGIGMTVETPGFIGGGFVDNARMDFDSVTLTPIIAGQLYQMGAGRVRFHTGNVSNPFFEIIFNGGLFQTGQGIGGSRLIGNIVEFVGPNVPTGLEDEQFSFALANEAQLGDQTTYTSSFTSSATPEPATLLALGGGVAAMVSRRRRRSA